MTTFSASNGYTITQTGMRVDIRDRGGENTLDGGSANWLDGSDMKALREFFQAERDEELGRWRWPEKPEYVVYPSELYSHPANPDRVMVVNEQNGQSHRADRDDPDGLFGFFSEAGHAYFEAHPERKPWHDAIPGQAWVVEWQTEDEAFEKALLVADFSVEGRVFADADETVTLPLTSSTITAARRIWPEAS